MNAIEILRAASREVSNERYGEVMEAIDALAEMVEADRAFDVCKQHLIHASNLITSGDRSDDAFRRQANTQHAYDRAVDRRRTALTRCGVSA